MRFPSEYFFSRFLTFHSTSVGGFLEPPPKYMSYSIFSRRSWSSNTESSSSIANAAAPIQMEGLQKSRLFKIQKPARSNGEQSGGIYHRPPLAPMCSRYSDALVLCRGSATRNLLDLPRFFAPDCTIFMPSGPTRKPALSSPSEYASKD